MILKPITHKYLYILIGIIVVVGSLVISWRVLYADNFSSNAFSVVFVLLVTLSFLVYLIGLEIAIYDSMELTPEGILALVRTSSIKWMILPVYELKLLKWEDMLIWEMMSNYTITLYGSKHKVPINLFWFKDGQEVIDFINASTKAKRMQAS